MTAAEENEFCFYFSSEFSDTSVSRATQPCSSSTITRYISSAIFLLAFLVFLSFSRLPFSTIETSLVCYFPVLFLIFRSLSEWVIALNLLTHGIPMIEGGAGALFHAVKCFITKT